MGHLQVQQPSSSASSSQISGSNIHSWVVLKSAAIASFSSSIQCLLHTTHEKLRSWSIFRIISKGRSKRQKTSPGNTKCLKTLDFSLALPFWHISDLRNVRVCLISGLTVAFRTSDLGSSQAGEKARSDGMRLHVRCNRIPVEKDFWAT